MARGVTYFDPFQERRIDGDTAMRAMLEPIAGQIKVDRYDMIDPRVQQYGDAALLTFNLISYRTQPNGVEAAISSWNASEIYARIDGRWTIVHSHWSFIKPELKQAVSEGA
jgi:ketosteroid isomerase-like protein